MTSEPAVSSSIETMRGELALGGLSTSTLTFIVWIDEAGRRDWVLERARMLAEKYPSFLMIFDRTGAESGEPRVSCGGSRNCVSIDASALDADGVDQYVSAFCRDAVSTVLWWSGAHVDAGEILNALLARAQTLLVDSSGSVTDDTAVCSLAAFAPRHPEIAIRDLAWLRLTPWQDMIARFFDDPRLLSELYTMRALHITSGSEAEALYLGAWLASRLGWTASGRSAFTARDGKEIAFTHEIAGQTRRVHSVCLDTDGSWYHGEVTDDPAVVAVWVEGEYGRERSLVPLQAIDNASLLERAILEPGADEVFVTALSWIATLVG